jgi:exonuclease III
VGDLNSLARSDNYAPDTLDRLLKVGVNKFGTEALKYDVTDFLLDQGFIDAARRFRRDVFTVPTAYNQDVNHALPMRLDYVFATPSALAKIVSVEVVNNEDTNTISDHYPIVVRLRKPSAMRS